MNLQDTLNTIFGGIFAVLILASVIGAILKYRLASNASPIVIDNLNSRINAWWAMILLMLAVVAVVNQKQIHRKYNEQNKRQHCRQKQ